MDFWRTARAAQEVRPAVDQFTHLLAEPAGALKRLLRDRLLILEIAEADRTSRWRWHRSFSKSLRTGAAARQLADLAFHHVARQVADHPWRLQHVHLLQLHLAQRLRQAVKPPLVLDDVVAFQRADQPRRGTGGNLDRLKGDGS